MRLLSALSCALAALTLSSAALGQPSPPTPGEVLGAAGDRLLEITTNAAGAQRQIARGTVLALRAAADDGATDEQLARIGRRGIERLREVAGTARAALNRTTSRAASVLEAIEAPTVFFHALSDLRQAAGERLQRTTGNASQAIRDALADLLEPEASRAA